MAVPVLSPAALDGLAAFFAADRAAVSVAVAVDGGFAAVMATPDRGTFVVPVLFGSDAAAASFAAFLSDIPSDIAARRFVFDLCLWCDNPRTAACHSAGYRTPRSPYAVARCPFIDPSLKGAS